MGGFLAGWFIERLGSGGEWESLLFMGWWQRWVDAAAGTRKVAVVAILLVLGLLVVPDDLVSKTSATGAVAVKAPGRGIHIGNLPVPGPIECRSEILAPLRFTDNVAIHLAAVLVVEQLKRLTAHAMVRGLDAGGEQQQQRLAQPRPEHAGATPSGSCPVLHGWAARRCAARRPNRKFFTECCEFFRFRYRPIRIGTFREYGTVRYRSHKLPYRTTRIAQRRLERHEL